MDIVFKCTYCGYKEHWLDMDFKNLSEAQQFLDKYPLNCRNCHKPTYEVMEDMQGNFPTHTEGDLALLSGAIKKERE